MLMTKVPREIFRFKQTHKLLTGIEERIGQFETGALHDNAGAVRASILDLASQLAKKAGRPDIAAEFGRESDDLIAQAKTTPTYRKGGTNRFRKRARGKRVKCDACGKSSADWKLTTNASGQPVRECPNCGQQVDVPPDQEKE